MYELVTNLTHDIGNNNKVGNNNKGNEAWFCTSPLSS